MEGYLVYFVYFLYGYGFLSVEKARGVKFCMHIGLLSGQVFCPFGERLAHGEARGRRHYFPDECPYEIVFGWPMPCPYEIVFG